MKVLALVSALHDTSPGQRFRVEQWARYLERDGVEFDFVAFEDEALHNVLYQAGSHVRKASLMMRSYLRRISLLRDVRNYDVVFLYREASLIGPAFLERLLARRGVPLIYDFDDPIWLPYQSPKNGIFSKLKFLGKTATICRLASRVMVGNRLLAEWAQRHARHVDVVPSTIDLDQYPLKPDGHDAQTVTLGWTGSHSTLPFLDQIIAPLNELATRHTFRLIVISHTDQFTIPAARFEVVSRKWSAATEATDLHEFDIGLGPFPDSGWTPWRCHGKVLQYMAVGLPCVVSRLGILPDYVEDGSNGFLAHDASEWVERLSVLIENPRLRREMGLAGRRVIEDRFSAQVGANKLRQILDSVTGTTPTPREYEGVT